MREDEFVIIVAVVAIIIAYIPFIFFLNTLQNTLKAVSPHNRRMSPGQVWLSLIPFFNIVWNFIVVIRVADSLADEFFERGMHSEEARPGYGVGLAYCILGICGLIPFLGTLASLAGFVCWIVYWVKIAGYKNKLGTRNFETPGVLDANNY
jgi:hypothetical protein